MSYSSVVATTATTTTDNNSTTNNVQPTDTSITEQYQEYSTLNEECSSWYLLARQAVVDVMFLDTNIQECFCKLYTTNSSGGCSSTANNTTTTTATTTHSIYFAEHLNNILTSHSEVLQQHKLHCYLQSIQLWLPRISFFSDIKNTIFTTTNTSGYSGSSSNLDVTNTTITSHEDEQNNQNSNNKYIPQRRYSTTTNNNNTTATTTNTTNNNDNNDRNILKKHTVLIKQIMLLLQKSAVVLFTDFIKDIKPVLEISECINSSIDAIVLQQLYKYCSLLSQGMEQLAGIYKQTTTSTTISGSSSSDNECIYTEYTTTDVNNNNSTSTNIITATTSANNCEGKYTDFTYTCIYRLYIILLLTLHYIVLYYTYYY